MCRNYLGCKEDCPLRKKTGTYGCGDFVVSNPSEAVEIVEEWSKKHPIITNAMKFKEVFHLTSHFRIR